MKLTGFCPCGGLLEVHPLTLDRDLRIACDKCETVYALKITSETAQKQIRTIDMAPPGKVNCHIVLTIESAAGKRSNVLFGLTAREL